MEVLTLPYLGYIMVPERMNLKQRFKSLSSLYDLLFLCINFSIMHPKVDLFLLISTSIFSSISGMPSLKIEELISVTYRSEYRYKEWD